ncbi:lethal(2)neighbour of tid protein 2 [Aedes albopictus]|uniref:dolichyl-P-Man:Man5GlcNAc2-PP-dolichol alpha-1,3-mannosyltransferase n=1 Tax=Aedes albopictus TaxID=7160 RepID=A0ABM1Y4U0_AEDAL|nr:lethal(2)neighbour of tid protein 2 [Aedes albopictus]
MAPPGTGKNKSHSGAGKRGSTAGHGAKPTKVTLWTHLQKQYLNVAFVKSLIFDPARLPLVSWLILAAELVLNVFVVQNVPYTEIDWKAYMQECEGFLNGTTNYAKLRGDTGPLVYPAGFVYIYSALYFITSHGHNIRLAQYIFVGIYMVQMWLVLRLYSKTRKLPPYVLVITTFTSYRIHSIYVLRLFNDPIAILFLYVAINLYIDNRWTLGSIFLSLGVSVKMNVLLFAPAIFLLFLTNLGIVKTIGQLAVCGMIQLLLGAPFLMTHPWQYLKGSFDLGRIFEHKWTVNYRFLEREIFENKTFHLGLLGLHVLLLIAFASPCYKYFQNYCRLRHLETMFAPQIAAKNREMALEKKKKKEKPKPAPKKPEEKLTKEQEQFLASFEKGIKKMAGKESTPVNNTPESPAEEEVLPSKFSIHFDRATQLALLPIFLSNFIGIVCARSLHYQFYVWYFHSLPYLTWFTEYSTSLKFLLLLLLEFSWNTYPSTAVSSLILHTCHIILLVGIGKKMFRKIPELSQVAKATD